MPSSWRKPYHAARPYPTAAASGVKAPPARWEARPRAPENPQRRREIRAAAPHRGVLTRPHRAQVHHREPRAGARVAAGMSSSGSHAGFFSCKKYAPLRQRQQHHADHREGPAVRVLQNPLPRGEIAPREHCVADVHVAVQMQKARTQPRADREQQRPQPHRRAAQQQGQHRPHRRRPAPPAADRRASSAARASSQRLQGQGMARNMPHAMKNAVIHSRIGQLPLPYMRHPCHRITLPHMRHARRHSQTTSNSAASRRQICASPARYSSVHSSKRPPPRQRSSQVQIKCSGYRLTVSSSSRRAPGRFCQSSRRTSRRRAAP